MGFRPVRRLLSFLWLDSVLIQDLKCLLMFHRVWLVLPILLLIFPVINVPFALSADISWCDQLPERLEDRIRCALWELTGFTRPQSAVGSERGTGPVSLGTGRWAQGEAAIESLATSWPDQIKISFFEGQGKDSRLTEKVIDQGLNGLSPRDDQDSFLRFVSPQKSTDLLNGTDPDLLEMLNREYLAKVLELLTALKDRESLHPPMTWQEIAPGLELARLKVFRFIRLGENEIIVVRVDPDLFHLIPYSFQEIKEARPLSIEEWAGVLPQSVFMVNAGFFYPDYRHLGLLCKKGQRWGSGFHPTWKGLFLSGRPGGNREQPSALILDLEKELFDPENSVYPYALQSFMLLDRDGHPRVKQTDSLASRTAVAQDFNGKILFIFVPGACTLYELALLLKTSDLGIKEAMCLDGGFEAQLFVRREPDVLALYGAWVVNEKRQYHNLKLKLPLPAVIAAVPAAESN